MPLMIVSVSAYLTILVFEPHSIYGMRLAQQGKLVTHHTDRSVLTLMTLDSVIERDYESVSPDAPLSALIHSLAKAPVLPVLDAAGNILGEIDINKIRHIIFRTELYHHFQARQLMEQPLAVLRIGDPMEDVMRAFETTGASHLPVLADDGRFYGYITRAHLYSQYRQMVADFSQE